MLLRLLAELGQASRSSSRPLTGRSQMTRLSSGSDKSLVSEVFYKTLPPPEQPDQFVAHGGSRSICDRPIQLRRVRLISWRLRMALTRRDMATILSISLYVHLAFDL